MASKRELITKLKEVKKGKYSLLPCECDELILLLGGTTRERSRPKKPSIPYNRAMIGDIVFSFMERYEMLEANKHEYTQAVIDEAMLTCAKNRKEAIIMAVTWFERRNMHQGFWTKGINGEKHIENQLSELQRAAGCKQLSTVAEWKKIHKFKP